MVPVVDEQRYITDAMAWLLNGPPEIAGLAKAGETKLLRSMIRVHALGDLTAQPAQVNSRDATTVAVTVAAVTYRHDTAIAHSPSDAQRRARPWLAAALAAQLDGGPAAAPGGVECLGQAPRLHNERRAQRNRVRGARRHPNPS